jgi:hypothetical protein
LDECDTNLAPATAGELTGLAEVSIVENPALEAAPTAAEDGEAHFADELAKRNGTHPAQAARAAEAMANLTLSSTSLASAREVRQSFEENGAEAAEQLLERFVADETAVALDLQNAEAASIVLLARAILDPDLAGKVAKMAREVVALSSAIRARTERTLARVADLRAQRAFLAAHRRPNGT